MLTQSGTVRTRRLPLDRDKLMTFAEFVASKDNCSKQALRSWLAKLETLLDYMKTFKDQASVDELTERLKVLYGFMDAMGMDTTGKVIKCK